MEERGPENSREMRKIACPCWKRFYFMALTDVPMCCPAVARRTKPAPGENAGYMHAHTIKGSGRTGAGLAHDPEMKRE